MAVRRRRTFGIIVALSSFKLPRRLMRSSALIWVLGLTTGIGAGLLLVYALLHLDH